MGNLKKANELLNKAFTLYYYDNNLNKLVFYTMYLNGEIDDAIDFLDRIYARFSDVFWINYQLGL